MRFLHAVNGYGAMQADRVLFAVAMAVVALAAFILLLTETSRPKRDSSVRIGVVVFTIIVIVIAIVLFIVSLAVPITPSIPQ